MKGLPYCINWDKYKMTPGLAFSDANTFTCRTKDKISFAFSVFVVEYFTAMFPSGQLRGIQNAIIFFHILRATAEGQIIKLSLNCSQKMLERSKHQ